MPRLSLLPIAAMTIAFGSLHAHHSFSAEFDSKKPLKLEGKITGMEWINPHSWVHIDVTGPDGKVTKWMVECGPPGVMLRRGFTKRSLENGATIIVQGYQAKNGDNRMNGSQVIFADGRKLFVGGSNPDDPENSKP